MMQTNLIPAIDPNALPAPYWVFKLLLIVTFFLHILAMNIMLGGAALAVAAKGLLKNRELGKRIFADIAKKIPTFLSATITLGIAPLLFMQVLYGQFFYTSSIIMAWPWFLVLVLLTVAYYGFYFVAFRALQQRVKAGRIMLLSLVLITLIGFIFSNNLTLSQTPSRWGYKYFADPAGWNLNLSEPTLIPRFLHFFISAIAVGGLLLVFMAFANWKRNQEYARSLLQFGGMAFLHATMAQFAVGFWFLISLPLPLRLLFMGEDRLASTLLAVGIAGGFGATLLCSVALHKENIRLATWSVPAITGVVILTMCMARSILRNAYLSPYFHPEKLAVNTQWSPFALFLVVLPGGVLLWLVMLRRYGLLGGRAAAGSSQKLSSG